MLADRTHRPDKALAVSASFPAEASKLGCLPGQKNFEIYDTLTLCKNSTRLQSPPPPSPVAPAPSPNAVTPYSSVAALLVATSKHSGITHWRQFQIRCNSPKGSFPEQIAPRKSCVQGTVHRCEIHEKVIVPLLGTATSLSRRVGGRQGRDNRGRRNH